jgi:hypothetical protein
MSAQACDGLPEVSTSTKTDVAMQCVATQAVLVATAPLLAM